MEGKKAPAPHPPRKKQGYVFYNHRRATPVIFFGVVIVVLALVISGVVMALINSVKLSSVDIKGETAYTEEDILNAAQIKMGDKLYRMDVDKLEAKILDACPYICEISLSRGISGKLTVKIKESVPEYCLFSGSSLFVMDGDFRLLEISGDKSLIEKYGLLRISATNLSYTKLGAPIKFGGEKNLGKDTIIDILAKIKDFKYFDDVDFISFDDKYNLFFTCGERFKVTLGDKTEVATKLKKAAQAIDVYYESSRSKLHVDVSDPSRAVVGSIR